MVAPKVLTRAPLRTVRPASLSDAYTQPKTQLRRMASRAGSGVIRLAHGFYCAPPDDADSSWRPDVEAAAAGIATAIYGDRNVVLMGMSAARILGAYPRAISTATVAAPAQHAPISLAYATGVVTFVKRNVEVLHADLDRVELGPVLVTSAEQTVLDLVRRPSLAVVEEAAEEAVRNLLPQCDRDELEKIAERQRMRKTLARLERDSPR